MGRPRKQEPTIAVNVRLPESQVDRIWRLGAELRAPEGTRRLQRAKGDLARGLRCIVLGWIG